MNNIKFLNPTDLNCDEKLAMKKFNRIFKTLNDREYYHLGIKFTDEKLFHALKAVTIAANELLTATHCDAIKIEMVEYDHTLNHTYRVTTLDSRTHCIIIKSDADTMERFENEFQLTDNTAFPHNYSGYNGVYVLYKSKNSSTYFVRDYLDLTVNL